MPQTINPKSFWGLSRTRWRSDPRNTWGLHGDSESLIRIIKGKLEKISMGGLEIVVCGLGSLRVGRVAGPMKVLVTNKHQKRMHEVHPNQPQRSPNQSTFPSQTDLREFA